MNILIKRWFIIISILSIYSCSIRDNNTNNNPSIIYDNITQSENQDPRKITILYTNDEHGWIEKSQNSNGAANMMGVWRDKEGYDSDESYLILSGGDNWLGPPISNLFKGESVVDVMNTMEYDASAIGNHEFEFGIENLYNRLLHAKFPYLSANILEKSTGERPSFATPYIIKQVNEVKVGIIGLTTISTPNMTVKEYVEDYEFIDYLDALNEIVPIVKSDGAELIVVIAHICQLELISLSSSLIDMGISVVCGGHCHREIVPQIFKNNVGKIAVIQANPLMQGYAKVEISFDTIENKVIDLSIDAYLNEESVLDQKVENVVTFWKEKLK